MNIPHWLEAIGWCATGSLLTVLGVFMFTLLGERAEPRCGDECRCLRCRAEPGFRDSARDMNRGRK